MNPSRSRRAGLLATLAVPAPPRARVRVRVRPPRRRPWRGTYDPQTRYVVTNHGFTYVLRESQRRARRQRRACSTTGAPERLPRDARALGELHAGRDRRAGARDLPGRRTRDRGGDQGGRAPTRSTLRAVPEDGRRPGGRSRDLDPDGEGPPAGRSRHDRLDRRRRPARRCPESDLHAGRRDPVDQRAFDSGLDRAHDGAARAEIAASRAAATSTGADALQGLLDAAKAEIARLTAAARR